jgi:hypothetical protein
MNLLEPLEPLSRFCQRMQKLRWKSDDLLYARTMRAGRRTFAYRQLGRDAERTGQAGVDAVTRCLMRQAGGVG